ncbi:MAG: hypothetical protein IJA34_00935 [Lachnospiraceae bacterium]|nr:hypothetical protein [Lachnospiraceae bacterium]
MQTVRKTIYSKEQHEKDLQSIKNTENGKSPLDLSVFKRLMTYDLCSNTNILEDYKIGRYRLEDINKALMNPRYYSKILVDTSDYLMNTSSFYMRINNYFAKMGLFNFRIDTYDLQSCESEKILEHYRKDYLRICSQIEKMNLKHEFSKIMSVLPSQDIFYGLIFEDNTDFFIVKIPYKLCQIVQIQDGVYNYRINLSAIEVLDIDSYPVYLKQAYLDYKMKQNYLDGYYIPPADKQICIKLNEHLSYPLPLMIMLARDIFDIDLYKKLKLQKARVDNYKAIVVEIPIDKSSVDKPLLTEETIMTFAETNKANMPDDVGLIHTLGSAEAISFKDNTNNTNNLSDAIGNLYDASGTPSQLFNGTSSGSSLKLSIENDAAFVYQLYRQFERYMNRFIKLRKFNSKNYKFKFRIQDSTVFNQESISNSYLKAAEHGIPAKIDYAVSLGISQNCFVGNLYTENVLLKLHEKLIPLPTSYTLSSEDVGRPTNDSSGKELSDSGQQTADNDSNAKR